MESLSKEQSIELYLEFKQDGKNRKKLPELMTKLMLRAMDQGHFKQHFVATDCHPIAAAEYLALIAYPSNDKTDNAGRIKFCRAMLSATLFEGGLPAAKRELGKETIERIIENFGLQKLPKDYERTISGGISRLQKRLYVYHTCRRYDDYLLKAPENDKRSFYDILYETALSYKD